MGAVIGVVMAAAGVHGLEQQQVTGRVMQDRHSIG
jgi:hypothetical protein